MNKIVYKYEIPLNLGINTVEILKYEKILSLQIVDNKLFIWILLNSEEKETVSVNFHIYFTGQNIPTNISLEHLETLRFNSYILHIFKS